MTKSKKSTLPKSRAELRERYRTKYLPQSQSCQQCQPQQCQPQQCQPQQCQPQQCQPQQCQPQQCQPQQCNILYQPHYGQNVIRQCLHAPYNCVTHRQRGFWCSFCTSTYMFPEIYCNHSPYVSLVNSQPPCQTFCGVPQTCTVPQTT